MYKRQDVKSVRKIKKGSALILALILFLSGGILARVKAAVGIETDRMCSISFELDGDLEGEDVYKRQSVYC